MSENMGRPVGNRHKVPKKQWAKWTNLGKKVFNEVYENMRDQGLYSHTDAVLVPKAHWNVTRYNAAFVAACAASRTPLELVDFDPAKGRVVSRLSRSK